LDDDMTPGEDLRQALQLDDTVIELSLTPNRGDCLGIAGIARDAAAVSGGGYTPKSIAAIEVSIESPFDIQLLAPEDCPRYAGRLITGIDASVRTPVWMQERLRRSGIRSINIVVDITNYVLLELGQPMHAFDAGKINTGIRVTLAGGGEQLTLLDGQDCTLSKDTLIIADADKPLALAGIMGGQASAVETATRDIFLESAFFQPLSIIGKARQYGLHTDSSHRFERGVDYRLQETAIERATGLILEYCGGAAGPVQIEEHAEHLPMRSSVNLRRQRIERVLGLAIPDAEVQNVLTSLGMRLQTSGEGWQVTPPSFRFDIEIEADLIEELARVRGYDSIPRADTGSTLTMHPQDQHASVLDAVRCGLVNRGYQEAVTYSFIDPDIQQRFQPRLDCLELSNPIASDLSVMRTSLVPGLVQALQYNLNRQHARVRLFETGLVYLPGTGLEQVERIAGVICGPVCPDQWAQQARSSDFYDLKADVEFLLRVGDPGRSVDFRASQENFLHPGQSCGIFTGGTCIGAMGALHPSIQTELDISQKTFVFELETSSICSENSVKYAEFSRFPSVRRDISVLVDAAIPASEIINIIEKSATDLLSNLELFDLYQGEGIEIGKKSLTFGLTFQGSSSTLIDSEVDSLVGDVVNSLQQQLGATLRE
ncbi:MAG: phenylalanine--tRNA ligase subunit beta, partial [Thiotrichales bacterium]|nr:phenylalanine--tRNA ligase subunit beta [Thiotrichales bacterium]